MTTSISEARGISWFGFDAVLLRCGRWEAIAVPSVGANLVSLTNAELGADILRTPENREEFLAAPQVYGIPLLYFPNRIDGGVFRANGREYRFPLNEPKFGNHIHGFLHRSPWTVLSASGEGGAASLAMEYRNAEGTAMHGFFPYDFSVRITYILSREALEQEVRLKNLGPDPLPAGLGFHTAFKVPFLSAGAGCSIGLSAGKRLELGERHLPTGRYLSDSRLELDLREGSCPAGGFPISAHYTAEPLRVDGRAFHGAMLTDTVSGISLRYEVDEGYGFWMLWNKSGNDGFICPEPQTMAVNAPNHPLMDGRDGLKLIESGADWTLRSRICVLSVS